MAWISRARRLSRDGQNRIAATFVKLAMIRIILRRLAAAAHHESELSRMGSQGDHGADHVALLKRPVYELRLHHGNEVSLSELQEPNWSSCTDVDFIALIALRRTSFPHEQWRGLPVRAAKQAIRSLKEFYDLNVLNESTISEEKDYRIGYDDQFLCRAYRLLLDREPSSVEREAWKESGAIGFSLLAQRLFLSDEAFSTDGVAESLGLRESDADLAQQIVVNQRNFDLYIKGCIESSYRKSVATSKLSRLPLDRLVVGLNFFGMSAADVVRFRETVSAFLPNLSIEVVYAGTDDIIDNNSLDNVDIVFMNNNNLYYRYDDLLKKVSTARCVSCCWLWDNHHQFEISLAAAQVFDVIFPAHSNGQTYLHNGRAIVGPIVPCSVFQWSSDVVQLFFHHALTAPRSALLYGRFNSYPGRLGFRDQFLHKVEDESHGTDVKVIQSQRNSWFQGTPEARYIELAGFKAVLCNPIFNDVPARVFDAVIAGCIPIVPYGLPDINLSFNVNERAALPIVSYIPNSMESLKLATAKACQAFDDLGVDGIIHRYQLASNRHMVYARLATMVAEITNLRTTSSLGAGNIGA